MEKTLAPKDVVNEIAELIDTTKATDKTFSVPIVFDGSQYALKIPKQVALQIGLSEKDLADAVVSTSVDEAGVRSELTIRFTKEHDA